MFVRGRRGRRDGDVCLGIVREKGTTENEKNEEEGFSCKFERSCVVEGQLDGLERRKSEGMVANMTDVWKFIEPQPLDLSRVSHALVTHVSNTGKGCLRCVDADET